MIESIFINFLMNKREKKEIEYILHADKNYQF